MLALYFSKKPINFRIRFDSDISTQCSEVHGNGGYFSWEPRPAKWMWFYPKTYTIKFINFVFFKKQNFKPKRTNCVYFHTYTSRPRALNEIVFRCIRWRKKKHTLYRYLSYIFQRKKTERKWQHLKNEK